MQAIDDVAKALREHPFLYAIDPSICDRIADLAVTAVFQASELIYREHQPADRFYLIRHGRVALEVHVPGQDAIIVETLRAGDPLGWSWLVPPYRSHFDARALELTRTVSIDAVTLRERMEHDPALGLEMYKRVAPVVASRLAAARRQFIDLYAKPAERGVSWR